MTRYKQPRPSWRPSPLSALALVLMCAAAGATFGMWPRDDVPERPDAVVVLGGVGIERARLGIELSERYDATLVLSSSAGWFAWHLGVKCGEDALCISPDPKTTTGEAREIAMLAEEHGWAHVTVATTRFHTTRARVLFRQCLGNHVTVVGARADENRGLVTHAREALGTVAALTFRRAC